MAIIRSKIARQLLADGGVSLDDAKMMAPKGEFLAYINPKEAGILRSMGGSGKMTPMGIPSFTEDEEDQAAMNAPDYSSQDLEEQAAIDAGEPTAQMSTMARDFQGFGGGDNLSDLQAPTFFQNLSTGISNLVGQGRRGQNILNFLNRSTAPTMRGRLGLGRRGDINYILEQLQANKGDPVAIGLTDKQFEIGQKLIDAGIKDETDIRNMTQSQFDDLFPGPQKGEGGDSEPIKKLRAPITEKKEEPKDEFADILKFYGARFAKGGSTGFEGSPEMGGRGTEETYGFDQSGPAGDSGDDGGPPTGPIVSGDGPTINVSGFGPMGRPAPTISKATRDKMIEDFMNLDTGPTTLTSGQLQRTQPTELETRQKDLEEIGRSISDPGSLFGRALTEITTNRDAMKEALKEYGGPRFEDGGEVRQNYGLGSIVKKATGALKKVLKSDLGKAAILGFGAYKLAGSPSIFGKDSFIMKNKALSGILGTSLAAGLFAKQEEEDEKLPTVANTDPEMTKFINFYGGPRRFAEDGGDIEDAPMKTASMPSTFGELNQLSIDLFGRPYDQLNDSEQEILIEYFTKGKKQGIERATAAMGGMMEKDEMLDLDGKEMDLRGGGFVPLGEYEKKDDVPARLSKNEFVFTADAVRAAGGGSVDKGADVMYKTMKTLENKVA